MTGKHLCRHVLRVARVSLIALVLSNQTVACHVCVRFQSGHRSSQHQTIRFEWNTIMPRIFWSLSPPFLRRTLGNIKGHSPTSSCSTKTNTSNIVSLYISVLTSTQNWLVYTLLLKMTILGLDPRSALLDQHRRITYRLFDSLWIPEIIFFISCQHVILN